VQLKNLLQNKQNPLQQQFESIPPFSSLEREQDNIEFMVVDHAISMMHKKTAIAIIWLLTKL
jgi:hypothetical protein